LLGLDNSLKTRDIWETGNLKLNVVAIYRSIRYLWDGIKAINCLKAETKQW